jgi:hypothetical protein
MQAVGRISPLDIVDVSLFSKRRNLSVHVTKKPVVREQEIGLLPEHENPMAPNLEDAPDVDSPMYSFRAGNSGVEHDTTNIAAITIPTVTNK